MKHKVGDFQARTPFFTVDGFTNPSCEDRFCLGLFTNTHRDQQIERVRRYIGKGLQLCKVGGNVFVENLMGKGQNLFVESQLSNLNHNFNPCTILKVPAGATFEIFNFLAFANLLAQSVTSGYEAVYRLCSMCLIRISLIKGWGPDYRCPKVATTPCWLEISLDGPLRWQDKVLRCMPSPKGEIHSHT